MSTGETPLSRILKDLIREDGPLPVARYMELCLGHPEHGYYQARDPFGATATLTGHGATGMRRAMETSCSVRSRTSSS